jgi:CDP-diacylglycerol--serine O-phosphatidyltransferase
MVSTVRFPSFKELNWRSRASFGYLLIGVLIMLLIAVKPEVTLFLLMMAYIILSLLWNVAVLLGLVSKPVRREDAEGHAGH